mmetsp:Transcript_19179/g.20793  ORF Transcript_19179/g.20793 Transcript_19179/m.20793 type:complete len:118 (-) Transcript_19179:25-378(-)|eukprot:gene12725-13939_t
MADRGKEEVLEDDEDQEEEDVAVERLDSWFLYVHVREKTITVSCGDASQRIKWLAHVAIARWDDQNCQGWKTLGIPTSVRLYKKDGDDVDMNLSIREVAKNGDHLFVETSLSPNDFR